MTKITFNLKDLKDFIDDVEEETCLKNGTRYTTQFRLTEEGVIESREFTFSRRVIVDKEWKPTGLEGHLGGKEEGT